ncbi:MAG: hypothetical protein FWC69_03770 [Defluviitaleaceae bacterium]|nr:hypothetical protein [Defluviitaleaceae bacterium]
MKRLALLFFVLLTILFLAACGGDNDNPYHHVSPKRHPVFDMGYRYDEPYPLDNQEIYFVTTMRIHEDMPYFTFTRIIGEHAQTELFSTPQRYVSIIIQDEDDNTIQKIEGIIQGGDWEWMTPDEPFFDTQLEDLNFDGYLDIRLSTRFNPGTAGGMWEYYWLWHMELGQFVKNYQLSDISSMATLDVNPDTEEVMVMWRGGGAGPWGTNFYQWIDGELHNVASILSEAMHWSEYRRITRWNHVTGEMTVEYGEHIVWGDWEE